MKQVLGFMFGIISYLIGVMALVLWIVTMLGFMPFEKGPIIYSSLPAQIISAAILCFIFSSQHTLMARS